MTLRDLIARHEQRQAAIPATTVTPRGQAVAAALKLRRQLAALDPADRASVLALLAEPSPRSAV